MNDEEKKFESEIHTYTTEKLMSKLNCFGSDPYYGRLGDIVQDEITRRLDLFDKLVKSEITLEQIPDKDSERYKTHDRINEILGNNDASLIYDIVESNDYKIKSVSETEYRGFDIIDTVNNEKVRHVYTANQLIDYCLNDHFFDYLEHEAHQQGISNIPQSGDEWRTAVTRPDLQDFIEGHKTEIAEALLIADWNRVGQIDLKEVAEMFKEADKEKEDIE